MVPLVFLLLFETGAGRKLPNPWTCSMFDAILEKAFLLSWFLVCGDMNMTSAGVLKSSSVLVFFRGGGEKIIKGPSKYDFFLPLL